MAETGHISTLALYAKDTDATATIRGYKYQELKTLELWLHNKVNGINESIYCDFEEDIFYRDLEIYKSTFKQVKLYSSKNFSFASEEVKKALGHFFTLFVKGEHLYDEPSFVFHTNTSVARSYGENDAKLLQNWVDHQGNLCPALLKECIAKVKTIIKKYLEDQDLDELKKRGIAVEQTFDSIPEETWEDFVKSIFWEFIGVDDDRAIEASIENIQNLITQLPFPIPPEQDIVFEKLRGIVAYKSMMKNPEHRVLTNEHLDTALLTLGDKDDKEYLKAFELWKAVDVIEVPTIGEFYQVLHAAKHCRRSKYLKDHSKYWLHLLNQFYQHQDVTRHLKRAAAYELIWSTLRPEDLEALETDLTGQEDVVRDYYSDFEGYTDTQSIEDAINLFSIVRTFSKLGILGLTEEELLQWHSRIGKLLERERQKTTDGANLCHILKEQFIYFWAGQNLGFEQEGQNKARKKLDELITTLPEARRFQVSRFNNQITKLIELAINSGRDDEVDFLEELSNKLAPIVKDREGNFNLGKNYIDRGYIYSKRESNPDYLKALDSFHKAKDLWFNEDSYEGFALALLSVSQLYSSIGLHLAAKYYALAAIWFCISDSQPSLLKRVSQSYALLQHSDFMQGSWITLIDDFSAFNWAKQELENNGYDFERDDTMFKVFSEFALALTALPVISPQLHGFVEVIKNNAAALFDGLLIEMTQTVKPILDEKGTSSIVEGKVDSPPINDLGKVRVLTWKALNVTWKVRFPNTYLGNSVSEEFVSIAQIILGEMALAGFDFDFKEKEVIIDLELSKSVEAPELLTDNGESWWKVFVYELESADATDKNRHYVINNAAFQVIIKSVSSRSKEELDAMFNDMFESGLANKTFIINAYQRMYRDVYDEEHFVSSQRDMFNPEMLRMDPKQYTPLASKGDEKSL